MKKPRILIFSIAYEPLIGGAELAVREITDRLSQYPPTHKATADAVNLTEKRADPTEALAKEGEYEFDLITCRLGAHLAREETIGNVKVYRVGFGNRLGRLLYPALAFRLAKRLHNEHPYQLVWSIMAAYGAAAALMFLRRFPEVIFLLTLQEGDAIAHIHRRVRGFKKYWQRAFKRADAIQAISKFLVQWARAEGATCPIEVIPNGVDIEKFKNHPPRRTKIKISNQNAKVIITVSRLVPKNGIDILIRSAAELKSYIPHSKFYIQILGSGAEEKKLKQLATDLGVSDIVEFVGEVDPDKVPKYLQEATVFVRPSRSEGLGSAFLEAMAAGLPVIGTAVGGIPGFLVDGRTGFLVRPEDPLDLAEKIKLILTDEQLRKEIAENGRQLVLQKYSWNLVAEKMRTLFAKLIL